MNNLTIKQLKRKAKSLHIKGYSKLTKKQLINVINKHNKTGGGFFTVTLKKVQRILESRKRATVVAKQKATVAAKKATVAKKKAIVAKKKATVTKTIASKQKAIVAKNKAIVAKKKATVAKKKATVAKKKETIVKKKAKKALPLDLENIIMDYKNQLELREAIEKEAKRLFEKDAIIDNITGWWRELSAWEYDEDDEEFYGQPIEFGNVWEPYEQWEVEEAIEESKTWWWKPAAGKSHFKKK